MIRIPFAYHYEHAIKKVRVLSAYDHVSQELTIKAMLAEKMYIGAEAQKKRIFIVDDHPVVRRGLTYLINQQNDLMVCGESEDVHDALRAIEELKPDMAIVDISLKGSNGIDLIRKMKKNDNSFNVLVLSMHDESLYAELVLREGAMGYITKLESAENILVAMRRVLSGEIYISDKIASKLLHKFINGKPAQNGSLVEHLSKREREVFRLIGLGYGTQKIAKELYIGVKTVETHRAHIKKKLKIEENSELIKFSIKWVQSQMIQ